MVCRGRYGSAASTLTVPRRPGQPARHGLTVAKAQSIRLACGYDKARNVRAHSPHHAVVISGRNFSWTRLVVASFDVCIDATMEAVDDSSYREQQGNTGDGADDDGTRKDGGNAEGLVTATGAATNEDARPTDNSTSSKLARKTSKPGVLFNLSTNSSPFGASWGEHNATFRRARETMWTARLQWCAGRLISRSRHPVPGRFTPVLAGERLGRPVLVCICVVVLLVVVVRVFRFRWH